jgi:mannosyltransferase OCH1-like enzyme
MKKYIHYIWVGDKPLPSLAKKCIKSWRKYLPDWEIIEWNEKNFDIENACPFAKQAYAQKKWAFVADYIRTWVLYNYGGLYFDTDMEVLSNIDELLKKPAFLGREYEGGEREMVAAGVVYVEKKHDKFIKDMLDFYDRKSGFNSDVMYTYSIPKVITRVLERYPKETKADGVEVFDERIWVYPKDYFYPVNFDWTKKFYSDNTVMIHHYDASWTGSANKRNIMINKTLPTPIAKTVFRVADIVSRTKGRGKWLVKGIDSRIRTKASVHLKQGFRLRKLATNIAQEDKDFLIFSQPRWLGVSHVAEDMFGGYISLMETHQYTQKEVRKIAELITGSGKKLVIFNGLPFGWERIIRAMREIDKNMLIKVVHHGGDVRLARPLDYGVFMKILELHNTGLINEIGLVKKQQAEFYQEKGFRVKFIENNVVITNPEQYKSNEDINGNVRIGLYCSGDIEWKNVFNQIGAASLVKDVELDCVPLEPSMVGYADKLHINIVGQGKLLPRQELLRRMASNDVNLYVSFAEASPMLPLESMELGVPCITANNHHYWTGTPLEEYLTVNRPDDIMAIYAQIEKVLKNRQKIMKLYRTWKTKYNAKSAQSIKEFLK